MKLFNNSRKLLYAMTIYVKLNASLLLNASLRIYPLTFIPVTEVLILLLLSGVPSVASTELP